MSAWSLWPLGLDGFGLRVCELHMLGISAHLRVECSGSGPRPNKDARARLLRTSLLTRLFWKPLWEGSKFRGKQPPVLLQLRERT